MDVTSTVVEKAVVVMRDSQSVVCGSEEVASRSCRKKKRMSWPGRPRVINSDQQ